MPVLGHAFVGLATASCIRPSRPRPIAGAVWAPTLVGLAYLPDIVAQAAGLAGFPEARIASHSVLFAVAAAVALAWPLAKLSGMRPVQSAAVVLFSVLVHVGLDLFQATDRLPWWPFSTEPAGLGLTLIPGGSLAELVLFGGAFGLFVVLRWEFRRWASGGFKPAMKAGPRPRRPSAAAYLLTAVILLFASATHYLRDLRERDLAQASQMLAHQRYRAALKMLERARPWPSAAKPGRIDYLEAEAYLGLGDRRRAEQRLLASFRADPSYFWVVRDLAVFYASGDRTAAKRRLLAAPYVQRLRTRFAGHVSLSHALQVVDRKLARPPS